MAVVSSAGATDLALLGDRVAAAAAAAGWAGLIVDGCVRDVADLRGVPVGILARGACPRRSEKGGGGWAGSPGVPVVVGGCVWRVGDWVYVDEDGVVLADRRLHPLEAGGE